MARYFVEYERKGDSPVILEFEDYAEALQERDRIQRLSRLRYVRVTDRRTKNEARGAWG